jgi:hypothetical protein
MEMRGSKKASPESLVMPRMLIVSAIHDGHWFGRFICGS